MLRNKTVNIRSYDLWQRSIANPDSFWSNFQFWFVYFRVLSPGSRKHTEVQLDITDNTQSLHYYLHCFRRLSRYTYTVCVSGNFQSVWKLECEADSFQHWQHCYKHILYIYIYKHILYIISITKRDCQGFVSKMCRLSYSCFIFVLLSTLLWGFYNLFLFMWYNKL